MRALSSPWPLGVSIVVLSGVEVLTAPSFDEELARVGGPSLDPEVVDALRTVGAIATPALGAMSLASLLFLVFWKYPRNVQILAWCKDLPGRSLLWSLMLGGSAALNAWDAVSKLGATRGLEAACSLGWAVCLIALRGVVVSRLVERSASSG